MNLKVYNLFYLISLGFTVAGIVAEVKEHRRWKQTEAELWRNAYDSTMGSVDDADSVSYGNHTASEPASPDRLASEVNADPGE